MTQVCFDNSSISGHTVYQSYKLVKLKVLRQELILKFFLASSKIYNPADETVIRIR